MNKNFETLKKKFLISAIIKSVSAGLSAGLIAVGIVLLAVTLSGNAIHWGFYILIGFVCTAAVGGATFLILLPNDRKVAKKYDKEFALRERLQTMVEFAGQEGDIISLQRQEAGEKLSSLPKAKIKFSRVWQYAVCALLALCVFVSGVTVTAIAQAAGEDNPWKNNQPDDEEPDVDPDAFEYDLFKEARVSGVIEDVRESALADGEKNAIIDRIYALSSSLANVTSREVMKGIVTAAVADIDTVIYNANSFSAICASIGDGDEKLCTAIVDGVLIYRVNSSQLNTADRLRSFKNRIIENMDIALENALAESFSALKVKQQPDNPDDPTLKDVLDGYIGALTEAIENYGTSDGEETGKEDLLVTALKSFISELAAVPVDRGYTNNAIWGTDDSGNPIDSTKNIRKAYDNLKVNLNTALNGQCYNCAVDMFVRLNFCEIFEMGINEFPAFYGDLQQSGNSGNSGGGEDDPNNNGSGSIGTGDENYGGNDLIYDIDSVGKDPEADPEKDGYVEYGDVLDKYQAIIYGKLENMEISEDMMKIIENYLKNLYYKGEEK